MKKRTLLIVEDDARFLKMLSFLFIAKGFDVMTARNGLEGLKCLDENIPSLIILDLLMPQMDGFSLYWKIKEEKRLSNLPVIILSGLSLEEIMEKLEPGDLKLYLKKPFRTADILALAADALNAAEEQSLTSKQGANAVKYVGQIKYDLREMK